MKVDKEELLKNCIYNNYVLFTQKYPNKTKKDAINQTAFALSRLLFTHEFDGFSRGDRTRTPLIEAFKNSDEYIDIILSDFIKKFINSDQLVSNKQMPLYNAMIATSDKYGEDYVKSALKNVIGSSKDYTWFSRYYRGNTSINYRYELMKSLSPEAISDIIADTIAKSIVMEKESEIEKTCQNINNSISQKYSDKIKNFQVNPVALNMCKHDIEEGIQQSFTHIDYNEGNLYASMDLGNHRKNQEDSVIILTHPQNKDFKMLVVADGAGGSEHGEEASHLIVSNIMHWFEQLDSKYFYNQNLEDFQYQFNQAIKNINHSLFNKYHGNSYSTFIGAIVGEKNTIISNVGDSRAYKYVNGELQQLTEDDSGSYTLFKSGEIERKDDIRFHKYSSAIFRAMGFKPDVTISSQTISNKDYDTLLLFSDGVTDCLSDDQIKAITRYTSPADLAKSLVQAAKETLSVARPGLDPKDFYSHIKPGKDNATAAVYDNSSLRKDLKNPIKQLKKSIFGKRTDDDSR